ncbi:hypothetical protein DFQ26_003882 [Actinomortierella ambigua]|nr:hypothetical protein DFQ26_003882 [Actinomortierella ambigua]
MASMSLLDSEGCYCAQGQDCPHWIETTMEHRIITIKERTHERMSTAGKKQQQQQQQQRQQQQHISTAPQSWYCGWLSLRSALHEIEKLATTSRDLAKMNQELDEARLQAVSDQTRAAKRLMLMSSQLEYTEQRLYKLTKEVDDGHRDSDLLRIERIKREALQEREDASRLTIEALQDQLQEAQQSERTLRQKLSTVQTKYETLGKRYEMMKRQQQEQELARESKEALAWLKETTDRLCSPPQGSLAQQFQEKSNSQGSVPANYSPGSSPTYSSSFMDPPLAAQNQLISLIKELATTNSTLRSELGEYRDLLQDARNEVLVLRTQVEDFEHSHALGGCCAHHGDEMASSLRTARSAWSGLDPTYPGLDAVSHIGTLGTSVPGSPPPYMTTAMAPSQQHHHHHFHLPGVRGNVFGELDRLYSQQQQQHLQQQGHRDKTKKSSHRKLSKASDSSTQLKSPRKHHHHHRHHVDTSGIQTVSTSTSTSELRRGSGTPTLGHKRLSQTSNSGRTVRSSVDESSSVSPSSHRSRKSQYTDVDMDMLDSGTEREDRLDEEDVKNEVDFDEDAELLISDSGSGSDDQGTSLITAFAGGHSRSSSRPTTKILLPPATLGDELAAFGGLNPPMSDTSSSKEDDEVYEEEPMATLSSSREHGTPAGPQQQHLQPHSSSSTPIKGAFAEGIMLDQEQHVAGGDMDYDGEEYDEENEPEQLQLNRTSSVSLLSSGLETAKRLSIQSTAPFAASSSSAPPPQQQQPDPRDDTSTPVPTANAAAFSAGVAMSESELGDESRVGPLDLDLTGKRMSEYDMIRLESAVSALDRNTPKYSQFSLHDKSVSEQDFVSLRQRRRLSEPWQTTGIGKGSSYPYRSRQGRPGSIYSLRRSQRQSQQYSPRLYSTSVMGLSGGTIHGIMGGAGGGGSSQSFGPDSARYLNPELAEQRVAEQRKRMMEAWRVGVVAAAVTQQQSVHTIAAFDQKKMDIETMSIRSKVSRRSKTSRSAHRGGKGKDRVASTMDQSDLEEHNLEMRMVGGGRGQGSQQHSQQPSPPRARVSLEGGAEVQSTTTTTDHSTLMNALAVTVSTAPTEVTDDIEGDLASKAHGAHDMPSRSNTTAAEQGSPSKSQHLQPPPLTINTNVVKTPSETSQEEGKTAKAPRKRRSFNQRLQTSRSTKSPIMRSPYIPRRQRLSGEERRFPSETSGISEFSVRHMGHHHGPYQLLHTLAVELLERLKRSDTRDLNRRLQRTFDIHALSQMSNSVIENVLTDVNNLGERFRWVEAQVAEPEDELMRTAAADTVSLRRTTSRYMDRRRGNGAARRGSHHDGSEGSGSSARMSSASEVSGSEADDDDGEEEYGSSDYEEGDDDDDALSDEMDWNFSVEEFFPLAHLVQEMLSEIGRLRMTINELQLSYVQKVEQDRLRAEKDFQDELENDEAVAAAAAAAAVSSALLESGQGKDGRRRRLGDIAEEGSGSDALSGFKTLLSKKRDRPKILETASTGVSGFFSKVFGGGGSGGGGANSSGSSSVQAASLAGSGGLTGNNSTTNLTAAALLAATASAAGTTTTTTTMAAAATAADTTGARADSTTTPVDPRMLAQRKPTAVTTETSKVFAETAWISTPRRTLTAQTISSTSSTAMAATATATANVSNSTSSSSLATSSRQPLDPSSGGKTAVTLYRSATASKLSSAAASLTNIAAASPARKWSGLPGGRGESSTQDSLASIASGSGGGGGGGSRQPSLPIQISPANKGLASTLIVSANVSPTSMGLNIQGQAPQAEAQLARSLPSIRSMHMGLTDRAHQGFSTSPTMEPSSFGQVAAAAAAYAQGEEDEDDDPEDTLTSLPTPLAFYSSPNKSTSLLITSSSGSVSVGAGQRQTPQRQRSLLASPARLRSMAGRATGPALSVVTHQDVFEEHWASLSTPASPSATKVSGRAAAVLGGGRDENSPIRTSATGISDASVALTANVDNTMGKGLTPGRAATVSSSSSSVAGVDGSGIASSGPSSSAASMLVSNLTVIGSQGSGPTMGGIHSRARAIPSIHSSTSVYTPSVASTPSSTTAPSWIESRRSSSNVPSLFAGSTGGGQGDAGASSVSTGSVGSGGHMPRSAEAFAPPPSDAASYLRLQQQQQQQQQHQQQQQQQPFALIKSELGALFGGAQHGTTTAVQGHGNGSAAPHPQPVSFGGHKGKSVATPASLASTSTGGSAKVSVEILDQDPEELEREYERTHLATVVEDRPHPSLSLSAAAAGGMNRQRGSGDSYEQRKTTTTAVAFDQGETGTMLMEQQQQRAMSTTDQFTGRRRTLLTMVTTTAGAPPSTMSSSSLSSMSMLTPGVASSSSMTPSTMSSSTTLSSLAPPISQMTGSTSTAVAYVVAIPEQPSVLDDPHSETGVNEESVLGVMVSGGGGLGSGAGGIGSGGKKRAVFDRDLIRASQKRILTNIATTGSLHPTLDPMASSSSTTPRSAAASATPKSATAAVKSLVSPSSQPGSQPKAPEATHSPSSMAVSRRQRHQRSLSVDSLKSNEPLQEKEVTDFWRVGAGVSRDLWGAFKKKLESTMPDSDSKAKTPTTGSTTEGRQGGAADKEREKDSDTTEDH